MTQFHRPILALARVFSVRGGVGCWECNTRHQHQCAGPNHHLGGTRVVTEYDEETGVYYMGAQYYELEVKGFLSQDPATLLIGIV